jgi:hypothetical protein
LEITDEPPTLSFSQILAANPIRGSVPPAPIRRREESPSGRDLARPPPSLASDPTIDVASNEAEAGDNVNLIDQFPVLPLPMDIIEEHTSLISGLVGEFFNPAYHDDQTPAEVQTNVEELVESLMVQHVRATPRVLHAVKALATARFLHSLRTAGVVATQPSEAQNGHNWQFLSIILALLAGAILATLFLRSQPLQLLQVSIYKFAEWLWRFVYYVLICVTGPTETDESLWNPGWEPTVAADNWQDEYKAVPDPHPNMEPNSDDDDQVHNAPQLTRPTLTPMPTMSAPTSEDEPDLPQLAAMKNNTPLAPPGEPMIIWKTYGLSVPLSLYNDSHQVRKALMDKVQETRSQQTGAKLCAFSRKNKEMTYAEAYENKGFRKWYLDRLHGPTNSLSPFQRDFAVYCAEREETERNFYETFFPVGQQRISQVKKTETKKKKTVPQSSERASSSNEQPLQDEVNHFASNRVAFLSQFNKQFARAPATASSSKDDASTSSFSVINE